MFDGVSWTNRGVCVRVCRRWHGMCGCIGHTWARVVVVMWAVQELTSPPLFIATSNLQKNPLKWRTSANVWKKNLLLEYRTISPSTALRFALYLIQIEVKSKLFLLRNPDRVYMGDLCGQNKKFIYFSVLTAPFLSVLWGALFCFGFWLNFRVKNKLKDAAKWKINFLSANPGSMLTINLSLLPC